jgi:hypothetical protein
VKKFIGVSILALGLAAVSAQEAQAWTKFNFSIGFSINYEGANNSILWGLISGGPAPCCYGDCCGFGCFGPPVLPCAPAYPVYAAYNGYAYAGGQASPAVAANTVPAPAANGPAQAMYYPNQSGANQAYNPYGYRAGNQGYGSSQAPSYWYGY